LFLEFSAEGSHTLSVLPDGPTFIITTIISKLLLAVIPYISFVDMARTAATKVERALQHQRLQKEQAKLAMRHSRKKSKSASDLAKQQCDAPRTGPSQVLGNFGQDASQLDKTMMYQTGGNGSVTTKHELGLCVVDYFEYQSAVTGAGNIPQYVHNYYWDVNQNLFDTFPTQSGGADLTWCRVRKLEVWVMPQSRGQIPNANPAVTDDIATNTEQMFTVNAQVPGVTLSRDAGTDVTAYAMNTQVTNCLPSINPTWKKVLACDLQKTFKSGVARPFFAKGTPATYSNQCLFSMSIVGPTTGGAYQTGNPDEPSPGIMVKVKLWVDQPIATLNQATMGVFRNEDFALPAVGQNGPNFLLTKPDYAQIDLLRSQDLLK